MTTMEPTFEALIQDIRDAIAETIDENPNAPETDVTREVVECMILGEDASTQRKVKARFGLSMS